MKYIHVPREVPIAELRANNLSWSAGMYKRVRIPTHATRTVRALLHGYDKGADPGSLYYLSHSTRYLIRTKALQNHSALIYPKGDAITPLNPRAFKDMNLLEGDILLSKDSNIGECAMLDDKSWLGHTLSGGIVRLRPAVDPFYLFAFLKHPIFKAQLLTMVPRGATIAHANRLWLNCLIPFPVGPNAAEVMAYIAGLMQVIVEKEHAIRVRHQTALAKIETELNNGQTRSFEYEFPSNKAVRNYGRMDAGFWSSRLRRQIHQLRHYVRGAWASIYDAGFSTRRGPNLAVSVAGEGHYSDEPFGATLPLATPGDISDYMTIPKFRYYGNRRRVETVRHGEIMFAGKGVREVSIGHTWVNLGNTPFVTNFDSFLIQSPNQTRAICLAFLFSYLKSVGVFAKLSDTSNGGSFVQSHFGELPIPRFSDDFAEGIAKFYYSPAAAPNEERTLENFVQWHREWNDKLGIWDLDTELKSLQRTLATELNKIIEGRMVEVPLTAKTKRHHLKDKMPAAFADAGSRSQNDKS